VDLLTSAPSRAVVERAQHTYASRTTAMADALAAHGVDVPGRDGINLWVPVADQSAALLHLAAAGVRAASGDPFWITTPVAAHIRLTTASIVDGYDDLAALVAAGTHAGSWSGHR